MTSKDRFKSDDFFGVSQATYDASSVQLIGLGVVGRFDLFLLQSSYLALEFSSRRGLRSSLAILTGYNPVTYHLDLMFLAVRPSIQA